MTTYVIKPAPIGLAVDSDGVFGKTSLDALQAKGIVAILTYAQVLTRNPGLLERYCTHPGKFGVGIISYARKNGWVPSELTGEQDAKVELDCAHSLGIPSGVGLCDDVEGAANSTTPEQMIAHVDARTRLVQAAADYPISYLGWNGMLTSAEWQARPNLHGYFKAGGITRDRHVEAVEPARGWMAIQGLPFNQAIPGGFVDYTFLVHDQRGSSWPLVYAA